MGTVCASDMCSTNKHGGQQLSRRTHASELPHHHVSECVSIYLPPILEEILHRFRFCDFALFKLNPRGRVLCRQQLFESHVEVWGHVLIEWILHDRVLHQNACEMLALESHVT